MTIPQLKSRLAAALDHDGCAVFDAFPSAAQRKPTPFAALGLGSVDLLPLGFGDSTLHGATIKRCKIAYTLDIYAKTYDACLNALGSIAAKAALCAISGDAPALVISANGTPKLQDGLYLLHAEARCDAVLSLGVAQEAEIINLNIDGRITT